MYLHLQVQKYCLFSFALHVADWAHATGFYYKVEAIILELTDWDRKGDKWWHEFCVEHEVHKDSNKVLVCDTPIFFLNKCQYRPFFALLNSNLPIDSISRPSQLKSIIQVRKSSTLP